MATDSPGLNTREGTTAQPRRPPDYTLPIDMDTTARQLDLETRTRAVRIVCRLAHNDADRATLLEMLGLATEPETF
ncbi:hypothetical protein [Amycolatopsis sp. EV170708-02-1]|uniref:hypothetical protein n=1 Tax=Amycolatopsis sp. EV170708-02-1 TaxID=2919322 RepID=UPI001F0C27CF|nr:hypothetical protein [Amycolatopsis sp. EV170708-02-1]UMP06729.1 hypothetical protein MJQ72_18805 [Amycolatopsis sp. EV170708-02-1]